MSSTIDNIKAVNLAFGYSFPNEIAFPENGRFAIKDKDTKKNRAPKNCAELKDLNVMKVMAYVPVIKSQTCKEIHTIVLNPKSPAEDKAMYYRFALSKELGPVLGGIVLILADIFFTLLVKPFLNLVVYLHNKEVERVAKAKELEAQAALNAISQSPFLESNATEEDKANIITKKIEESEKEKLLENKEELTENL